MPDVVRLTVVGSQGEADVICSLLRAHGLQCRERSLDAFLGHGGGWGGWRLVFEDDLAAAQELLTAKPDAE